MALPELEISLQRLDSQSYSLDMRYIDPDSETDRRFGGLEPVVFDAEELRERALDPTAYGEVLAQQLFAEAEARSFFDQAVAASQAQDLSLRLRLFVAPSGPELHNLRWETLRLPGAGGPLFSGEELHFSRYLSSLDWRPVNLRPEGELQVLLVVANPGNVADYQLAEVETETELAAARIGLGDMETTELATRGQATLNNIVDRLRAGYDVLYLVAHGRLAKGEPVLYLEQEDGTTAPTPGQELVTRIRELRRRPRLVVLLSCQSAGTGADPTTQDDGALAGLGPRLAEAGVPAVIAMSGNIQVKTVELFTPVFFRELRSHGLVDRAMAVARGTVRDRSDWWMPVLFMRLRSGRIAYKPGLGVERAALTKAPALLRHVRASRCTPILGPRVNEWLVGSRREIALGWAETYGFPLDPDSRDSLPQVAQYLAVDQDPTFVRDELTQHLRQKIWQRHGERLSPNMVDASLDELIKVVGNERHATDETALFRVLAQLPLPIYVTTNPGDLLGEALRQVGKNPVVEICRWNRYLAGLPSVFQEDPDYRPSPEQPLVYHLFGRLSEPDSVVLTEDDYFEFLIGVTRNEDQIPPVVRGALTNTALLFLGFDLDDWDFRVLFRSIMQREGRSLRDRYSHIAAQIDPEAGRILEPEGARRYLEDYFRSDNISIFWGRVEDFAQELHQLWTG
jgi:hypothetical protein